MNSESKYLHAFEVLTKEAPKSLELKGSCMLVEYVEDGEKTKEIKREDGSTAKLVTSFGHKANVSRFDSVSENVPVWVRVLKVGEGYYDEEGSVPLDVKPGDIVQVGKMSVKWYGTFGDLYNYEPLTIGLTREEEVQVHFRGEEAKQRTFEILNAELKRQVGESASA